MAARQLREEPAAAAQGHGRPAGRVLLRRPRTRPGRARDHVDAPAAADAQHDGRLLHRRLLRRPRAALHAPRVQRPPHRLAVAPPRQPRLAARGRDVGGRGPHPPLPHQGARRDPADLPAVLRPLHPHGPGRQLHPERRQAQVHDQAAGPARRHARLPAPHPRRPRRGRLRRRRRQHAVAAAGVVRGLPARHRQHPRRPPGQQGAHGPAAALAAGRRPRRHGTPGRQGPRGAACRSRSTPTSTPPSR